MIPSARLKIIRNFKGRSEAGSKYHQILYWGSNQQLYRSLYWWVVPILIRFTSMLSVWLVSSQRFRCSWPSSFYPKDPMLDSMIPCGKLEHRQLKPGMIRTYICDMIHVYFFIWRRPFQHFPNTNDPSWHIVIGRSEIFRRRQSCSGSWRNRRNGWSQGNAGSGYRRTMKNYQVDIKIRFPWGLDCIVSVVHAMHFDS